MSEKRQFTLANESVASGTWKCVFYILLKAASPIIMGLEFLEQTKTMTEHRQRLHIKHFLYALWASQGVCWTAN
ncbi:hypothetical protein J4E86_002814 [Alternaria arbusti]|uniref:uncharacterized protein n=1 Tax=Alternaria arbusti TaxID=232088 RepID=UPI002220773F|nr:uncharacterized protein J4E86_002814 [Alternaria arbusti]KAI4959093.1 hypothetical protein J4E86_002814 [Alternaria arbusti]